MRLKYWKVGEILIQQEVVALIALPTLSTKPQT